jgi:hypothetical protein
MWVVKRSLTVLISDSISCSYMDFFGVSTVVVLPCTVVSGVGIHLRIYSPEGRLGPVLHQWLFPFRRARLIEVMDQWPAHLPKSAGLLGMLSVLLRVCPPQDLQPHCEVGILWYGEAWSRRSWFGPAEYMRYYIIIGVVHSPLHMHSILCRKQLGDLSCCSIPIQFDCAYVWISDILVSAWEE